MPITPPALHARSRAQILVSDVSVTLGGTRVLTGVDLTVTPTSRIAVVGENGRGKSTLLHILSGALPPDEGQMSRIGALAMAEQEMSTSDRRTVGEVVADAIADSLIALDELDAAGLALAEGEDGAETRFAAGLEQAEALDAWDARRRVDIALEALGAESDHSRPLTQMSVGQRYRVRLACLLGGDADFLLLDEPTNHLDRAGLDYMTEQLRARSGGIVIVSHDRALLADIAETTIDLDPTPDGRPRIHGGGYAGYRAGRRAERERWEQEYARQQEQRSKLQDDLSAAQNRLVSGWRPDKGTGRHQRATRAGGLVTNVHRRRAALEAHAVTVPVPPQTFRLPELSARSGATLVSAAGITVEGRLPEPVSLEVLGRTRLLVIGPNGSGKSTLLSALAGGLCPTTGRVRLSPGTRIAHLRQESLLPLHRRADEFFASHQDALISAGALPSSQAVGLSSLGLLRSSEVGRRIGELSMGQRRRLDLALALSSRPHLLLLDEPTNHLSISVVDELTEALRSTSAAVVASTHDRQLLRDLDDWPRLALIPSLDPARS